MGQGIVEVLKAIRTVCKWQAVIDGNQLPSEGDDITAIVKADQSVYCVAAASIVAKAHRDIIMTNASRSYPTYGFEKHKGYGTRDHFAALKKFGPCEQHRKSLRAVQNPDKPIRKEELAYDPKRVETMLNKLGGLEGSSQASDWEKQFVKDVTQKQGRGVPLSSRQMFFLDAIARRRGK